MFVSTEPPAQVLGDRVKIVYLVIFWCFGVPLNLFRFKHLWRKVAGETESERSTKWLKRNLNICDILILAVYVTSEVGWQGTVNI